LADNGLIIRSINNPNKKIVIAIGLKTSSTEKPKFLIDINSLFEIRFLNKNAIEIIITKGMISEIIVGNFKNESNKKKPNVYYLSLIFLKFQVSLKKELKFQ